MPRIQINTRLLEKSRQFHNAYPVDTDMKTADITSRKVTEVAKIIAKFNYQRIVRLRQLHRHLDLIEGYVLVERMTLDGYLTEPTAIEDIDVGDVCGQIFSMTEDGLYPTEFRYGQNSSTLNPDFVEELARVIFQNKLEGVLRIELMRDSVRRKMVEFSRNYRSLLCDERSVDLTNLETLRNTGWGVTDNGLVNTEAEVRCIVLDGAHRKITPKFKEQAEGPSL